jgi:hypothetical protein
MTKFDGGETPERGCFAKAEAKATARNQSCSTESNTKQVSAQIAQDLDEYLGTLEVAAAPPPATCIARSGCFCDLGATILDTCTGLEWTKRIDCGLFFVECTDDPTYCSLPMCAENTYNWSKPDPNCGFGIPCAREPDGLVFTLFLAQLNGQVPALLPLAEGGLTPFQKGCFLGKCDWRIPTLSDWSTIHDCSAPVPYYRDCIDYIFGEPWYDTNDGGYWSGTTMPSGAVEGSFDARRRFAGYVYVAPPTGYPEDVIISKPKDEFGNVVAVRGPSQEGSSNGTPLVVAGPITNPANGHTYYLGSGSSWTVAESWAVALGGHLVTINDAAEQDWVYNTFSAGTYPSRALWIGFHATNPLGPYSWSSGEGITYTNWFIGEPNDLAGETHAHMWCEDHAAPGTWNNAQDAGPMTICGLPLGVVEISD